MSQQLSSSSLCLGRVLPRQEPGLKHMISSFQYRCNGLATVAEPTEPLRVQLYPHSLRGIVDAIQGRHVSLVYQLTTDLRRTRLLAKLTAAAKKHEEINGRHIEGW